VIRNTRNSIAARAIGAAVLVTGAAGAQVAPWQNDWTVQKAPSLQLLQYSAYYESALQALQAPLVMSPDGEVLIRAPNYYDDQLLRFTSSGALRWSVNIGSVGGPDEPTYSAMIANADGGAFAATQYGSAVVRIDALGDVLWSTAIDVRSLAFSGQQLIVQSCGKVSALDPGSGQLRWQYAVRPSQCDHGNVVVDSTGNVYAALAFTDAGSNGPRVLKFSAAGDLLWQQVVAGSSALVVGTPDATVYVQTFDGYSSGTLSAVRADDGKIRWNVQGVQAIADVGTPGEVLVSGALGVSRLDAADGSARWTQSLPNTINQIIACSHGAKATVGASQLDLETGAIDWTTALASQDAFGNDLHWFATLCPSDGSTTFAALTFSGAPPTLQRVDAAGAPLASQSVPVTTQGVAGWTSKPAAQSIVAIAMEEGTTGPGLRLRALDAASGSTQWELVRFPEPFVQGWLTNYGLATRSDAAVVAMTGSYGSDHYAVWLGDFDIADGSQRWQTLLDDVGSGGQEMIAASQPLLDPLGNIVLVYEALIIIGTPGTAHFQTTIVKLSGVDGAVLWRHDDKFAEFTWNPAGDFYLASPAISLLGGDVLVGGPFAYPNTAQTLLKLSGTDGMPQWFSNVLGDSYASIFPTDDGNVILTNRNAWAKLDAKTGAALWSNVNDFTCVAQCVAGGGVQTLPGGDLVFVGQNASRAQIEVLPGHAGASPQRWLLDQDDTNLRQSFAYGLERDSSGALWTRIQRSYLLYGQRIAYLARLDAGNGTLLSQQAIYANNRDPLLPFVSPSVLSAPENNRMLAETYRNQPPVPEMTGVGLIDTTITANGNLSVQFTTSRAKASPGQHVGFHLTANYSGDAPISGARLIADFPWTGHAQGVICGTTGASNCVLDPRSDTLVATFDIQSGGRIDITGWIRDTDVPEPAQLSAIVVGPIGLNELATADNAVRATVNQSLFFDGFE
jgi:outer membrane protein assembly factor BamB